MERRTIRIGRPGFLLLMLGIAPGVSAEEPASQSAAPVTTQPAAAQRGLFDELQSGEWKPVRSFLVEHEMPLVGIHWGAQVLADLPLNGEPDGAQPTLREAQITLTRAFRNNIFGKLQLNYNNAGQFEVGDNYLIYSGWKSYKLTAGVFRPPYSLNSISKRAGLTFMERALPVNALSERRSGGIALLKRTPNAILNIGLFPFSPEDNGLSEQGLALVMHFVHAPLKARHWPAGLGGRGIWTGVSLSYRGKTSGANTQFRSLPEIGTANDYFVDTGQIDGAASVLRLGLETSKVSGSFSWQAELLAAEVQRDNAPNVLFVGGYALASWFLTGESRNYSPATGEFLTVEPKADVGSGGWGAWEIAVRASSVDLNDEDIIGGRQRDISLGLNWYLNRTVRIQTNIIKVLDVDRPGSIYDGEDPWIAALRVQWNRP